MATALNLACTGELQGLAPYLEQQLLSKVVVGFSLCLPLIDCANGDWKHNSPASMFDAAGLHESIKTPELWSRRFSPTSWPTGGGQGNS